MTRVYFIIGCTAGGKGSLGRELARTVGGQIVSVDSMKIYRRMDIGTGKPTSAQQQEVAHHCIDLIEPSEKFSVAQYVEHTDRAIGMIRSAGAVALAVGGTSLYVKALWEGLFDAPPGNDEVRTAIRASIEQTGLAAMHAELARIDPAAATRIHPNDQRRIVRAIEVFRTTGKRISELQTQWENPRPRYDCTFIGLRRDKDDQSRRINARAKRMLARGLRREVQSLLDSPAGLSDQAAAAVGYAEMIAHIRGDITLDEALERIKINTRRLAKKQRTWQRRWRDVLWFDIEADESVEDVSDRVLREVDFKRADSE